MKTLKLLSAIVAFSVLFPIVAAAAPTAPAVRRFGTAEVSSGHRTQGVFHVPAGSDAALDVPVIVISGRRPGPTIALLSGLHGTEYTGTVALLRLAKKVRPEDVSGVIVIVPLVNVPSFERMVRHLNPVDGKNMNRMFPGSSTGTQSERTAWVISNEILDRVDYVVDYHDGDLDEDQVPYTYWIRTADAGLDSKTHAMLQAYGPRYMIEFDARKVTRESAHLLPTQAAARGKPAITVDAGRAGGFSEDDLALFVDGTTNVLRSLSMLPGPVRRGPEPLHIVRTVYVNSPRNGVFHSLVHHGDRVAAGQRLGQITDLYGEDPVDILAPEAAVVLYQNSTPSAVRDEQLFYLGISAGSPEVAQTSGRR